ncbi:hypothetical protein FP433_01665 [Lactobacillus sp. PV012]|nr:hypothetical protein [Lactobacillus sp. PV012]QNQ81853.1 hypothetical protein FP433_01665 [Lactobacillus sp. PV012]
MMSNIWVSIIVLVVGLWDLYTAWKRRLNKKLIAEKKITFTGQDKVSKMKYPTGGEKSFLILGIIFTITGIVMLVIH